MCVGLTALAPLLAGGVHRGSLIVLIALGLCGLCCLSAGLLLQGRLPRVGVVVLAPLAFAAVPLIQSVPLPLALRSVVDPNGTALLQENQVATTPSWPLSLDPPNTRVDAGRAALALLAFIVAYHLASSQSRRRLVIRCLGAAGVAAVVIGLGHRILGIDKLYGLLHASPRSMLVGPFVNANHTAEFLELTACVCLACSFLRPTALNRIGWLTGALLCVGGAMATMSRGSVLAITVALVFFLSLRHVFRTEGGGQGGRRVPLTWALLVVSLIALAAVALGAQQIIGRFMTDNVNTDVRLKLWRNALGVLRAHPFGIGRGAFDRVFPIYQTFHMPFALRFAFVENEPLQLLIDCGGLLFLVLVAAFAVVVWRLVREGRRDPVELALVSGLVAVLAHNTVDFGLETPGVLLPFSAVWGAVLGRLPGESADERPRRAAKWSIVGFTAFALLFGLASAAHASFDDFDSLLRRPLIPGARRSLVLRAERTHPLDYFYALEQARLEPLKGAPAAPSPRLHALNRALRLCPSCEVVHEEVARNLWRAGHRPQALLEWRTAVDLQPTLLPPVLGELFAVGVTPEELAAVTSSKVDRMLELVSFLSTRGRTKEAFAVLDQAQSLGAAPKEVVLARAGLQVQLGQIAEADDSIHAAVELGVQDPRLAVMQARVAVAHEGAAGADRALQVLDLAAARYPSDLPVLTTRLDIMLRFKKWKDVDRALDAYTSALYGRYGSATDAHIYAARVEVQLGHLSKALEKYRIALADRPGDVALLVEYGQTAVSAGRLTMARDAYAHADHLSPQTPEIRNALHALDVQQGHVGPSDRGSPTVGGDDIGR